MDTALRGKSYNRGVRLYKLFYEALNRLLISQIEDHFKKMDEPLLIGEVPDPLTKQFVREFEKLEWFEKIHHKLLDLKIEWSRSEGSNLRKFWLSYLDMVDLLLNIIFACRSGQWNLLIECLRDVIPYAFAYDHHNYARYVTVMLGDMLSLPDDFPEIYQEFVNGNFTVQLSDNIPFAKTRN